MKDEVYGLERTLHDKITLFFNKKLNTTETLLKESQNKFKEYADSVKAHLNANVRDNVTSIDAIMRKKAEMYKDLSVDTNKERDKMK